LTKVEIYIVLLNFYSDDNSKIGGETLSVIFTNLSYSLDFMEEFENGILIYAHPARINPNNAVVYDS
jgi:hypothetical protein